MSNELTPAGHGKTSNRAERRRQEKAFAKTISRKCGECTACCTIMEVAELSKPQRVACSYASDGCRIYRDRPHSCRIWFCGWMMGFGRDEDRPDKSGVVVAPPATDNGHLFIVFVTNKSAAVSARALVQDLVTRARATNVPYGIGFSMGGKRLVFIPQEWSAYYSDKTIWETDPMTGEDVQVVMGDRLPWLHDDNGPQLAWDGGATA